jgi:hypothetical protein
MIGTQEEAVIAGKLGTSVANRWLCSNGMIRRSRLEYLSRGSTRIVFKSPTGVVYKYAYEDDEDNIQEYEMGQKLHGDDRLGLEIADCYLWETKYGPIIAMEYYPDGVDFDWKSKLYQQIDDHLCMQGVEDTHCNNIRMRDGRYYVIDYVS